MSSAPLTCSLTHVTLFFVFFRNHSPLMSFGASFVSFLVSQEAAACFVRMLNEMMDEFLF